MPPPQLSPHLDAALRRLHAAIHQAVATAREDGQAKLAAWLEPIAPSILGIYAPEELDQSAPKVGAAKPPNPTPPQPRKPAIVATPPQPPPQPPKDEPLIA